MKYPSYACLDFLKTMKLNLYKVQQVTFLHGKALPVNLPTRQAQGVKDFTGYKTINVVNYPI